MKWINFLHIYQPPTQEKNILDVVAKESYTLIPHLLEKYPNLRLTMNISGSLLELLEKNGYETLIKKYVRCVGEGRIELVQSAMYHPILPLIPEAEIRDQIDQNSVMLKKYFGNDCAPRGFYFPEMAYDKRTADILKSLGFEWIILDEIHAGHQTVDTQTEYVIKDNGLKVLFRNPIFSKSFPPEFVDTHMNSIGDKYLITAHDGELYGHWHKDDKGFYEKTFSRLDISFLTASQYFIEIKKMGSTVREIEVRSASWESTEDELKEGIPYGLWNDPHNQIHAGLWSLAHLAIESVEKNTASPEYISGKHYLDRGLASCAWWWASEKKLGPFSPVAWNPTEIKKGASELLGAIRTLGNPDEKTQAEKISTSLFDLIWKKHRETYDPKA